MILVIGGTGQLGSLVVRALGTQDVEVCVLQGPSSRHAPPPGVRTVQGDVLDVDFMRGLLDQTRTLFLLNPVVGDEATRALLTLDLAADANIDRVVYLSMINADKFICVPHAAAKFAAERTIEERGLPTSILRPNYFFQNDAGHKEALLDHGIYPMPIGGMGVDMVDARDIAAVAAHELVRREQAPRALPSELIEIVGPDRFTGDSIAQLWSEVLGRPVRYAGDDVRAFEAAARTRLPNGMAYDAALMFRDFQLYGMHGGVGAAEQLALRLGQPLRTYRAFAEETLAAWQAQPTEDRASPR